MPKKLTIPVVIILVMTLFMGCSSARQPSSGQSDALPDSPPAGSVNSSQPAPEIVLSNLQGQTIRLSDYRGQVVILNFWASWCPPCKAEMPDLEKAAREFRQGTDAVLLTINLTDGARETVAKANQYMEDNQFSMPVLLDTEGQAANAYKITSIPTTVIIDRQGNIRARFAGATTSEKLQSYVNQLK